MFSYTEIIKTDINNNSEDEVLLGKKIMTYYNNTIQLMSNMNMVIGRIKFTMR